MLEVRDLLSMITDYRYTAVEITYFLYVDGRGRNGLREDITKEECIALLQEIEREGYNLHNEVVEDGTFMI